MKTGNQYFKVLLIAISIFFSCNQKNESKFHQLKDPYLGQTDLNLIPSTVAFSVDEIDLIPEGITYDSKTNRFFLSSKNKDKAISIDQNGNHRDFIPSRQDSLLSSLGMKVDVARRRFWIVSNRIFGNRKVSLVHVFDADQGTLIQKFSTPTDKTHHLNDLILTQAGGAYITDTQSNRLFYVPPGLNRLEFFMEDSLIQAPNGITISPDNLLLYVESHYNGILIINLKDKSIRTIGNPMQIDTGGIDGLMYYKNSLIGIVNAQYDEYEYIARYHLNRDGTEIVSASIIDKANPAFVTPTTGVIVDNTLYVLAATCLGVYNRKQMDEVRRLHRPTVLKYNLEN